MTPPRRGALAALCAALFAGCSATDPPAGGLRSAPLAAPSPPPVPRIDRRVERIEASFDAGRAMATLRYVDRFFRVRGNDGYLAVLDRLERDLAEGGFAPEHVRRLELGPEQPTWTPVRASLELLRISGPPATLHAFDDQTGRDRATLLVGSHRVESRDFVVVASGDAASPPSGDVVVLGRGAPRSVLSQAQDLRGVAGILTLYLEGYHQADDHEDVAQFGYLPREEGLLFGFSISPRSDAMLRQALETGRGRASVRVAIDVKEGRERAVAVEATIAGRDPDAPPLVFVAHVDEPGANDNASGVAALLELALTLRREIEAGRLERPRHRLLFLWGQEIECSREWLRIHDGQVLAALVFDMVGADPEVVGAPFLIERMPDPGAVWMRPFDEPSGWGGGGADPDRLAGHFLNDVVLAAVRAVAARHLGWRYRDHPFEGGSDHVPFLARGTPALLGWHFPDDAYHTNRDRADRVSGEQMRRVSAAMGAAALSVASGDEADAAEALAVVRYAASRRLELVERASASARAAGSPAAMERRILDAWARWYDEALTAIPTGDRPALRARVEAARAALEADRVERARRLGASRASEALDAPIDARP